MRSTPYSVASTMSRIMVLMPPMPEPMMQPVRQASAVVLDRVLEAGVAHRLGHGRPRVVDVAVVAADLLLRHDRIGVEALDLAGDLAGDLDRVEQRDAGRCRCAR